MSSTDQNVGELPSPSLRKLLTDKQLGAIISLKPPAKGDNIWEAKQVDIARSLPPGDIQGRQKIEWGFGPIKVCGFSPHRHGITLTLTDTIQITGYIDTNTYEIGVSISVAGINVGNIFGNLKDSVGLKVDLFVAKGEVRLYLKHGNEIWVHLDIKITFDGTFSGEFKILSF